jgi:hypothetical protein
MSIIFRNVKDIANWGRKRFSMRNKYVNKLFSVTVIALLLLLGCASTKYLPSSSKTYSPTSTAVIYYWDKPDRPYIEMGTIKVKAQTENGMFERFKQKAMEIGADGVFIKSVDNKLRSNVRDYDIWLLLVVPIRAEGVAIKFKDVSLEK